jgi:hypothetical protein
MWSQSQPGNLKNDFVREALFPDSVAVQREGEPIVDQSHTLVDQQPLNEVASWMPMGNHRSKQGLYPLDNADQTSLWFTVHRYP